MRTSEKARSEWELPVHLMAEQSIDKEYEYDESLVTQITRSCTWA